MTLRHLLETLDKNISHYSLKYWKKCILKKVGRIVPPYPHMVNVLFLIIVCNRTLWDGYFYLYILAVVTEEVMMCVFINWVIYFLILLWVNLKTNNKKYILIKSAEQCQKAELRSFFISPTVATIKNKERFFLLSIGRSLIDH